VNNSVISALALAGAFDSLGLSRKYISENFMDIRKELQAYAKKHGVEVIEEVDEELELDAAVSPSLNEEGEEQLDDSSGDESEQPQDTKADKVPTKKKLKRTYRLTPEQLAEFTPKSWELAKEEFSLREKLEGEKATLGEYISGDLKGLYPGFFVEGRYGQSYAQLQSMVKNINFPTEGIVSSIREHIVTKKGKNYGKALGNITIENLRGESVEVTIWPDSFEKLKRILKVGLPIRGMFTVDEHMGNKKLILVNLESYYKTQVNNEMQ
jgi:DNA polymerase III alpha subunit